MSSRRRRFIIPRNGFAAPYVHSCQWKPQDEAALRAGIRGGESDEDIAERLGRRPSAIHGRLNWLRYHRPVHRRPPRETWVELATRAAQAAHVDPVKVMAGVRRPKTRMARWQAFKAAHDMGYSMNGIAVTAGFDYTTVRGALIRLAQIEARL